MKGLAAAAAVTGLLALALGPAEARLWKPPRSEMARDYLTIEHSRSENEQVVLMWFAPSMMDDTAENEVMRRVMSEYAMILVSHVVITDLGQWQFIEPADVAIETKDGAIRQPIDEQDLPLLVTTLKQFLSQLLAQGMGALGENALTHVYDATGINDCGDGVVWVRYAGERYEFRTPVPGCE